MHDVKLIIIDSITYQSELNTGKTADAVRAFKPVMDMAVRRGIACLALSHTNKQGEVLNRRLKEMARCQIRISKPDPDDDTLKLEVDKSDFLKPPALGMTHVPEGFTFGPPPEAVRRGRKPSKTPEAAAWLLIYLEAQPSQLKPMFEQAKGEGLAVSTLYDAKNLINQVHIEWSINEVESVNDKGYKYKYLCRVRKGVTPAQPQPMILSMDGLGMPEDLTV
jgi:hypothetical protein